METRDILALRTVEDPQLSPDGRTVAFVLGWLDADADAARACIWTVPSDASSPARQLTSTRRDVRPRWSPDGRRLAFLSNREFEWRMDLQVVEMRGGEARRVAVLPRGIDEFAWSPDGGGFALIGLPPSHIEPDRPQPDGVEAERTRNAARARHVDRYKYRMDPAGMLEDENPQLWWQGPAEPPRMLTSPDGAACTQPGFTADGRITFVSNLDPGHDASWDRRVYSMATDGGSPTALTGVARTVIGYDIGADGAVAATVSDPWHSWVGASQRLQVQGEDIAPGTDGFFGSAVVGDMGGMSDGRPRWDGEGQLWYLHCARGCVGIHRRGGDGVLEPVATGPRVIGDFDLRGGVLAFTENSRELPTGLRARTLDSGEERLLHDPNPWLADHPRPAVREIISSHDGVEVQGWMMLPETPASGGSAEPPPAVLAIHGGPYAAYGPGYSHVFAALCDAGYAVMYCNPPGSLSYGEDFARSLTGRWGEHDLPHLLAFTDACVATGLIDGGRIGAYGASYGGFMTLWLAGHTDRFRAIVSARPVSHLQGFYGASDIGWAFGEANFGKPWENEDAHRFFSPMTYVDRMHTPLRLIACTGDVRTPYEQAENVYIRLKRLGREVDLVLFPGEPHGVVVKGRPWSRVRHMEAVLGWFQQHMPVREA